MKKIVFLVLALLCGTRVSFAVTLNEANAESGKRYAAQVEREVQRRHELEVQRLKIEVLGRLQELSASQVIVNANAYASNVTKIRQSQENN